MSKTNDIHFTLNKSTFKDIQSDYLSKSTLAGCLYVSPCLCRRCLWDSVPLQADCGPVSAPLYTLPLALRSPRGHPLKHFLTPCQDCWQIHLIFPLTSTISTPNLLILIQESTVGFSRDKSTRKWTNSHCLCFGISKQPPRCAALKRWAACKHAKHRAVWKCLIPSPLHVYWINYAQCETCHKWLHQTH